MNAADDAAPRILVVLGATGTGKSALALSLAERLDGEIVGCDALQVYRGFDAATAKPSPEDRRRVAHHVIDCVDPRETFSAAAFAEAADRAIGEILARGRVPIVVGGSGLYLRSLLRGLVRVPPRDRALQYRLSRIADAGGTARLHRLLARHDPTSAARLAPTDRQRVIRAVELLTAGTPWSRLIAEGRDPARDQANRYRSLKVGLAAETAWLTPRLERRVDRFLAAGLADEVRGLLDAGVPRSANAFKAIGYREMLGALDAGNPPESVRQAIVRGTRRYAKRQRTWFRREPAVNWIDAAADRDANAARVVSLWRRTQRE